MYQALLKCFICITSFNPYSSSMEIDVIIPIFIDGET